MNARPGVCVVHSAAWPYLDHLWLGAPLPGTMWERSVAKTIRIRTPGRP